MTFTPTLLGSGLNGYAFLTRTREAQQRAFAQSPEVSRDVAYFKEKIASVETVDDLMDDRRLLRVALGSVGLQDDLNNRGFIRKVLESDLTDGLSLANRLSDKKYLKLARMFSFGGTPQLPGSDPVEDVKPSLQRLETADDLFRPQNSALLKKTLEVFDLQGDAEREVFLKQVLTSDVDDPGSLVNRLDNKQYAALARAFQGVEPKVDVAFLRGLSDDIAARMEAVTSAEELVRDTGLMRAALNVFGLEDDPSNRFFLQSVLESDLNDADSFANRQRDPRYAELAAAFGFQARAAEKDSVYGFADEVRDKLGQIDTVDALIEDETVLAATLKVLGLENDSYLATEANLRAVLESDLDDDASVAMAAEDPRYKALAEIFNYAEIAGGEDPDSAQRRLSALVDAVDDLGARRLTNEDFVANSKMVLATMNFFDLPSGVEGGNRLRRVALSDAGDANSLKNLLDEPRYNAFFDAMNFRPAEEERSYPTGFAAAVTEAYLERQFEVQVGAVDSDMRVVLSAERELTGIVESVKSNDARWFQVMSTPALRSLFESALNLPQSFGALDLDRQLEDFKDRSARMLGTNKIEDMLQPEILDSIRDGYLLAAEARAGTTSFGSSSTALFLLGNAQPVQQDAGYGSLLNTAAQL